MTWNFNDNAPIYLQIVHSLQRGIAGGVYPPGSRLPSVRELALEAGVNPNTMQRALSELERTGLVCSQRTAGRFVTEDAAALTQLRNTMSDMDMRMVPKMTSMSRNVILDKDVAKGLVDAAMEKCHGCVEGPEEGMKCPLYKVLESFLPLDSYENGMLCPYSMSEWKD